MFAPFVHLLKEVWLSIFVLFFRISRWKGDMKANSAVFAPTVLVALAALSVLNWVEIFLQQRIVMSNWVIGAAGVFIYLATDHVLVGRGRGLKFVQEFDMFSKVKQRGLLLGAILLIIVMGLFFYLTVQAYHRAFGIGQ